MGWLGSTTILVGLWLIGAKHRAGFLLGVLGEACWFARGWQAGESDLMWLSTVFVAINLHNWIKWGTK